MTTQPTTLRDRVRQAATEALLDSAEKAMIEKGYEKATMHEIAAAAGCATGTFYLYFKNKEELLHAIVARRSAQMHQAGLAAAQAAEGPLEKLRAAYGALVAYTFANQPFYRFFFRVVPFRHSAMRENLPQHIVEGHDRFADVLTELIRQCQQQNLIRDDYPAADIQEFMDNVGIAMVERFMYSPTPPPLEQQTAMLWSFITGGIGSTR